MPRRDLAALTASLPVLAPEPNPYPGHGLPQHQPLRQPSTAYANALLRRATQASVLAEEGCAILDDAHETAEQAVLWLPTERSAYEV
jgi:hypothetical protein